MPSRGEFASTGFVKAIFLKVTNLLNNISEDVNIGSKGPNVLRTIGLSKFWTEFSGFRVHSSNMEEARALLDESVYVGHINRGPLDDVG